MHYAVIMLIAGIGVPVLAAMNAQLGRILGAPPVAAAVLFTVAFTCASLTALVTDPGAFARIASAPKHLFLAGLLVAFYLLSVTWIAPHFGIGNAIFFIIMGQLISAATIDHFGLFGATVSPLSGYRALGISVMALGVFITQKA